MKSAEACLFVRLDDGEVKRLDTVDRILYKLEPTDIENDEYLFWLSDGNGVKVRMKRNRVVGFSPVENPMTLRQALVEFSGRLGVEIDESETPAEIWTKLQQVRAESGTWSNWWSRLLNRRSQ